MSTFFKSLGRGLRGVWWLLDFSRRALLNLLLLVLVAGAVWLAFKGGPPRLEPKTVLVLDLDGRISEQQAGSSSRSALLQQVQGGPEERIRLRDLLQVLDAAAKDDNISQALLLLDGFDGAGLPTLREVAAAIERFKASGKPVIAWGSAYEQRGYYLAAHASEVWLHPMGGVGIEGYGRLRSYYRELFDKVGLEVNVIRAGKFKNAMETFAASGPSPETLESDQALYDTLWGSYTGGVESARKLPAGSVAAAIESLPGSLSASGGDSAKWALQLKWVDALKTRDEMRAALIERGAPTEAGKDKTFRQVSFGTYLGRLPRQSADPAIGVIVAEGGISDGQSGPGGIGGRSTAELVRQARHDDKIKAIVLRVNSPGGSAFGSELVRHELELTRKAGKPVVVSMGDVAASGGYWISMAADEVIADEATITGSIGVIAMLPSAGGAFDRLGVRAAGTSTTWLGTAYDPRRGLEPRYAELVQVGVDHIYSDFKGRVAKARQTTPEKIDAVAQGRVWAGKDALAQGLVDRLGSYTDALQAAARRAKMTAPWRVEYIEAEPGRLQRLLRRFGIDSQLLPAVLQDSATATAQAAQAARTAALLALGLPAPALAEMAQDLGWLAEIGQQRQPHAALVHCLCVAP